MCCFIFFQDEPVLLIEKDNEWIEGTYYVISEESQNGSILQFVNGKVSFDGQHKAPGSKLQTLLWGFHPLVSKFLSLEHPYCYSFLIQITLTF